MATRSISLTNRGRAGELEGVIAVGLPLDVLPLPGQPGRAGYSCRGHGRLAEVMDPASLRTGLEHHARNRLARENGSNFFGCRLDRAELRHTGAGAYQQATLL